MLKRGKRNNTNNHRTTLQQLFRMFFHNRIIYFQNRKKWPFPSETYSRISWKFPLSPEKSRRKNANLLWQFQKMSLFLFFFLNQRLLHHIMHFSSHQRQKYKKIIKKNDSKIRFLGIWLLWLKVKLKISFFLFSVCLL